MSKSIYPILTDFATTTEWANAVEAYAQAASGRNYSPTIGTRRVTAALIGIGLNRSDFRVRNDCKNGEYQGAIFSLYNMDAHRLVAANLDALRAADIRVIKMDLDSGPYCFGQAH